MLTKPINDEYALTMMINEVRRRLLNPDVEELANRYQVPPEYADSLRRLPHLDDLPGVLPTAPRLWCWPPQRVRPFSRNPACAERSMDYLTIAEKLDPDTPRTLATVRIDGKLHTFPVEMTAHGPMPVILDSIVEDGAPANLAFATVAQLFGYGSGQPTPMSAPMQWAEQLAEREGVTPRNGADLLQLVERYADVFPGGQQALTHIAAQLVESGEMSAKPEKPGKTPEKPGKKPGKKPSKKPSKKPGQGKQGSPLGGLLRAAIIGYGGPAAVVAIDVLENRLNKRGYTLGSLAESRDLDSLAFK